MSDKKKPLWVSQQAHTHVSEFAEQDSIGMFEAANRLILSATPSRKAESSAPTQSEKAPTVEPAPRVPEVEAYAKRKEMSYEDALSKLLDVGIRRQAALDKAAKRP